MKKVLFFVLTTIFFSCATQQTKTAEIPTKFGYNNYTQAVQDAMVAEPDEVYSELISISPENSDLVWNSTHDKILVCSFFNGNYASSYPVNQDVTVSWGEMWVTVAPELKSSMLNYSKSTDFEVLKLRTEQLLGLPQGTKNTHIVEFWVNPNDLFRPSPDKSTTDKVGDVTFSDFSDTAHCQWFADKMLTSYCTQSPYPWTRLGYTYDWGNPNSEVGLSEFVIPKGAVIHVVKLVKLDEYLTK